MSDVLDTPAEWGAVVNAAPEIVRDLPMGPTGRRGRLLQITPAGSTLRFVLYRGTNERSRDAVAQAAAADLRALHDRRQDIERRAGQSQDLGLAIGAALDLPAPDPEVRRIVAYLQGLA